MATNRTLPDYAGEGEAAVVKAVQADAQQETQTWTADGVNSAVSEQFLGFHSFCLDKQLAAILSNQQGRQVFMVPTYEHKGALGALLVQGFPSIINAPGISKPGHSGRSRL